jgi:hypothetical protein
MKITLVDWLLAASGLATIAGAFFLGPSEIAQRDVLISLSTSYAVTVVFYLLVVWLPTQRKRARIKRSVISHYKEFKLEVLGLIMHAGGKAWSLDDLEALQTPKKFSEYFSEDETGSGMRWYEVLNGLDDYYVSQIAMRLDILRSELHYVLVSIDIDDQEVFDFMKRLDHIVFRMSRLKSDYEDQKSWGRFLWSLYSDFDPIVGHVPHDRNLQLLEKI